jgi:hypothetical protein
LQLLGHEREIAIDIGGKFSGKGAWSSEWHVLLSAISFQLSAISYHKPVVALSMSRLTADG